MTTISSSAAGSTLAALLAVPTRSAASAETVAPASAVKPAGPTVKPGTGVNIRLDLTVLSSIPTNQSAPVKDFTIVARDVRTALDAGYDRLGKVADIYTTGKEARETVGYENLDRRELWAIASNEGGLFSKLEQRMALSENAQRTSALINNASPLGTNSVAASKAVLDYLNDACPEEKANSFAWRAQLAVAHWSYEAAASWNGETPEHFELDDPILKMILAAMDERAKLGDSSKRLEDMPAYKQALEAFRPGTPIFATIDA